MRNADMPAQRIRLRYFLPAAELLVRWFAPPPLSIIVETLDLRAGGASAITMRYAAGNEFQGNGA